MSKFVGNLKAVTSRQIKKQHKKLFEKYYWTPALWTRDYSLLITSGATIKTIKKYIENVQKFMCLASMKNCRNECWYKIAGLAILFYTYTFVEFYTC